MFQLLITNGNLALRCGANFLRAFNYTREISKRDFCRLISDFRFLRPLMIGISIFDLRRWNVILFNARSWSEYLIFFFYFSIIPRHLRFAFVGGTGNAWWSINQPCNVYLYLMVDLLYTLLNIFLSLNRWRFHDWIETFNLFVRNVGLVQVLKIEFFIIK